MKCTISIVQAKNRFNWKVYCSILIILIYWKNTNWGKMNLKFGTLNNLKGNGMQQKSLILTILIIDFLGNVSRTMLRTSKSILMRNLKIYFRQFSQNEEYKDPLKNLRHWAHFGTHLSHQMQLNFVHKFLKKRFFKFPFLMLGPVR